MSAEKTGAAGEPSLADIMEGVFKQGEEMTKEWFGSHAGEDWLKNLDPLNISGAFGQLATQVMNNPGKLIETQFSLWQDYLSLWHHAANRMLNGGGERVAEPESGDRRFSHLEWNENPVFDFIKQSYLISARWLQSAVTEIEGLDAEDARKIEFYTRQYIEAMAPTNFALTNPEVIQETLNTGGQNLLKGYQNLLDDLDKGRVTMADEQAFELGKNVATSPGKVIYQNDLMQLIQYDPLTDDVFKVPLLIVPPWINKFYILDLQPKNSFIKWAAEQGHTVFVISWVNPDERLAQKSFDDYMLEGPLAALDAIEQATGERECNVIGYCIGGTLTAATLAYMAERNDARVRSATFFTTLIDFEEPGDLGVFTDEEQVSQLEAQMFEQGYLDGKSMATTFNMLRASDLIWSFVINNYLLGKEPIPFDLLYWNSDSTRMPACMHSFYLRKMYIENKLREPGGIVLNGVPVDLRNVKTPANFISTREDHIAPWVATYAGARLFSGPVKFTLGMSGHIAGIVNPPASKKYGYWTADGTLPPDPEDWLHNADEYPGSWWGDWQAWVAEFAASKVAARVPGSGGLPAIEGAPGSYVAVKS
jgi:polyhydroxyalkanoate synthase